MEPILDATLIAFPIIVFCVVVWAVVLFQRKIFETLLFPYVLQRFGKDINKSLFYKEVAIPAAPIGTSMILAILIPSYPLPVINAGMILGLSAGRIFIGIFLGLFCGFIYRMVKKYIIAKLGGPPTTFLNTSDGYEPTDFLKGE